MPFDTAVKAEMFTRCNRLCCLCLKQCGINIEAAHIIDEVAGGSNDAENGIPLCLDCHQEVGSYNDKHPKGNKIRQEELRARRDRFYGWVAEGMLPRLAPVAKLSHQFPNPLHLIIDLLAKYHNAMWRVLHAKTQEERLESTQQWRSCHPAVWKNSSERDNVIRRLADPAKEWLSQIRCPYVLAADFDLVEEGSHVLSAFAVSPSPVSMPDVYSKRYSTEGEL